MTKVIINPGICSLITEVCTSSEDGMQVTIDIKSDCQSVNQMFATLGNTFDAYDVCLVKPGKGMLYEYASENFPGHCSCSTIAGIIKAVEVECGLALPKDSSITFVKE